MSDAVMTITANDIAGIIESRAEVEDGYLGNAGYIAHEIYLTMLAASPSVGGWAHPVLVEAQKRGEQSFLSDIYRRDVQALKEAADALLTACHRADEDGDLSDHVDGTLMDDLGGALDRLARTGSRPQEAVPTEQAEAAVVGDWSEFEDDLSDAISDSIDMDWNSRDGAKAVIRWLNENAPRQFGANAWVITNKTTGKSDLRFHPLADLPFNRDRFRCTPLYTSPPPSVPAELAFGFGALVVNTGTFGGDNAVFIAKATAPGPIGEYTGNRAFKRDCLQPGEHVLIFPTKAQAQAVADAMCTPISTPQPAEGCSSNEGAGA